MPLLITGAAGFIGFHLCRLLLDRGLRVLGVDNLNDYYSVRLKKDRLAKLKAYKGFSFAGLDIADRKATSSLFAAARFDHVVHLAAQAGVRHSLENPHAYVDSNLVGMVNVLEGCRHSTVKHLVYASSSSVYGANARVPFSEHDGVDHPVSLYAATKKAGELLAHSYSHLYDLPTTGLRFFTVYGPWGRPDMALWRFTEAILAGRPIELYNHGRMSRDFTYVDDVVEGIVRVMDRAPQGNPDWDATGLDPAISNAPYRVFNIGNHEPVNLEELVDVLEQCLGRKAERMLLPMQPGDVESTYANTDDLAAATGFRPSTSIRTGLRHFVDWYCDYHHVARPASSNLQIAI